MSATEDPGLRSELDHLHREIDRLEARIDHLEAAISEHAGVVVREMERFYRDRGDRGKNPDLTPVLRAGRALVEVAREIQDAA